MAAPARDRPREPRRDVGRLPPLRRADPEPARRRGARPRARDDRVAGAAVALQDRAAVPRERGAGRGRPSVSRARPTSRRSSPATSSSGPTASTTCGSRFFGNYFGLDHAFQGYELAAVDRSELILLLPKGRTFKFHARNANLEPETIAGPRLPVGLRGTPLRRRERSRPSRRSARCPIPREFVPTLEVSTYQSWDEFAALVVEPDQEAVRRQRRDAGEAQGDPRGTRRLARRRSARSTTSWSPTSATSRGSSACTGTSRTAPPRSSTGASATARTRRSS